MTVHEEGKRLAREQMKKDLHNSKLSFTDRYELLKKYIKSIK